MDNHSYTRNIHNSKLNDISNTSMDYPNQINYNNLNSILIRTKIQVMDNNFQEIFCSQVCKNLDSDNYYDLIWNFTFLNNQV